MGSETINTTSLPPAYMQPHVKQNLANVGGTWDANGVHQGDGLAYQDQLEYLDQDGNPIPRVAEFNQDQMGAHQLGREGIGAWGENIDTANNAVDQGIGAFSTEAQQGRQDLNTAGTQYDIGDEYLNPYQTNVIDTTMSEMRRQQEMDMDSVGDLAASAGAYGGSRQGVLEAETIRGHDANRTNTLASLNSANFTQAQNAQEQHRQRQLQGATNSTSIAGMGADANFQGAQIASGIGGLEQQYNINDVTTLGAIGDQEQQQVQVGMDVSYNDYLEDRDRPYQMAAFYNDIMSGVPSGEQSSRKGNTDQSSLAQGLGALGTLASAGNQFGWWGEGATT
jgi:hypothetical protein